MIFDAVEPPGIKTSPFRTRNKACDRACVMTVMETSTDTGSAMLTHLSTTSFINYWVVDWRYMPVTTSDLWCFSYETFSNDHLTLPSVRIRRLWDEPEDEVKSRPPCPTWDLEDVTACSYTVTKHLNNLVISILLNYIAFSTELFNCIPQC